MCATRRKGSRSGSMLITDVQIPKFVESRGDVRQIREPFDQARSNVALMTRRGRACRNRHQGLV